MSDYKMKTGKLGEKVVETYKKVENAFVGAFLNEDGSMKTGGMADKTTAAYQKIEDAVVGSYKKVEGAFVDTFLEKTDDGEKPESDEATESVSENDK